MLDQIDSSANSVTDNTMTLTLETIPVVAIADDRYAMPFATMICSALFSLANRYKLHVFVLGDGMAEKNKRKIRESVNPERCQIEWVSPPKESLKDLTLTDHFVTAVYYRLLISELIPHTFDKLIYLDSDLVVNKNLGELWSIDTGDNYLLAVPDIGTPTIASGLLNYKELGIRAEQPYFNSGVLLINFKKWRDDKIGPKVIDYVRQYGKYIRWVDQDGLNAVLAGQWGELDPRWNQTPGIYRYSSWEESPFQEEVYNNTLHNPYIVHFASGFKPWNSYRHRSQALFYYYVDKTAWKGWRYPIWKAIWRRISKFSLS